MPEVLTEQPGVWTEADGTPTPPLVTIHNRLRRLEEAVSALQDTAPDEQHLTARILNRLHEEAATNGSHGLVPAFSYSMVPGVAEAADRATGGIWGRIAALNEFRLMVAMYFDPRYRLSRLAQFGVPMIVALVVLNFFFVGGMPMIGFLIERLALVVLAVGLYKILSWEAARYDAVLKYLAAYGR